MVLTESSMASSRILICVISHPTHCCATTRRRQTPLRLYRLRWSARFSVLCMEKTGNFLYPALRLGREAMVMENLTAGNRLATLRYIVCPFLYARKLILTLLGLVQIRCVQQPHVGSFHFHGSGRRRSRSTQPVEH